MQEGGGNSSVCPFQPPPGHPCLDPTDSHRPHSGRGTSYAGATSASAVNAAAQAADAAAAAAALAGGGGAAMAGVGGTLGAGLPPPPRTWPRPWPPHKRGLPAKNSEASALSQFWYGMLRASQRSQRSCMRHWHTLHSLTIPASTAGRRGKGRLLAVHSDRVSEPFAVSCCPLLAGFY